MTKTTNQNHPERKQALALVGPQVLAWVESMEELQRDKVLALARRLKPGLTLEDIRNPHDFPELVDPDWHYEDGVLTGIQSVWMSLRGRILGELDAEPNSDPSPVDPSPADA
jgi:hypothetical protein